MPASLVHFISFVYRCARARRLLSLVDSVAFSPARNALNDPNGTESNTTEHRRINAIPLPTGL